MDKLNSREIYLIELALRQMQVGVSPRRELELRSLIEKLPRLDIEEI